MARMEPSSGRLSLRNSILVWVAGIVIGWGCAVVLFYQLIRNSGTEMPVTGRPAAAMVAEERDATGLADIAPAAGDAAPDDAVADGAAMAPPESVPE
ncbi:hypothetical protein [Parapedomonas caeni]